MFFIITAIAAIASTIVWYVKDVGGKYKLGLLSLMLWGATAMMFIDHLIGYIVERGELLEANLDSAILGLALIVIALTVWEVVLLLTDPAGRLRRK